MKAIYTLFVILCVHSTISNAANFSSVSSGTWSAPATWSITSGTDADGIPDQDDDVVINGGHTVILINLQNNFRTLNINPSGILNLNSKALNAYGDFTINGTLQGSFYYFRVFSPCILTSSSSFTRPGDWHIYSTLTISAGTNVNRAQMIQVYSGATVNNLGSVEINAMTVNLRASSSNWINGVNSFLRVSYPFLGFTNKFNFSAVGNTVVCHGNCNNVPAVTYYNLSLSATSTKVALGHLTILNDFTSINNSSANVLDLNGNNLTIGGSWNNQVNQNVQNQGVITFNGNGVQNINRNGIENFSNLVINSTGTVNINSYLNVSQSLMVNSGVLAINATFPLTTLRVQGNLVNNATINCNSRAILFNGTSLQSISGSSNTQFHELILDNLSGIIINSPQSLTGVLTILNGNFNSNNNFTLISNATSTARIGPRQNAGCTISGNMIIQRHISARVKGWHDLSSPVQNTIIFDWDDEMYMSGFSTVDIPAGIRGVDGSAGGFKSVLRYDEPTATYPPLTNSLTPLTVGRGYEIWLADNMSNWSAKTIDTRGVPNFGNQTVNLSFTSNAGGYGGAYDGLNLIGNPFASAVNYSACTKTNMNPGFLVLDNSGNYVDQGANGVIPPHQGIWVQATSAGASIIFNENAKSTSNSSLFHRTASDYNIRLMFSSPQLEYFHENTINFNLNGTVGFDKELDMVFLKSPNLNAPSMYMPVGEKGGVITNYVSNEMEELTIPLALFTPSAGIYYIEPSILNRDVYKKVWIENIKTGKQFDLLNGAASIEGVEGETNKDYVLRLSKKEETQNLSQIGFENDLVVFNVENALNIKANHSSHSIQALEVYDLTGKLVMEYKDIEIVKGSIMSFDISNLSKGIYIVNVLDAGNHVINKKIVR